MLHPRLVCGFAVCALSGCTELDTPCFSIPRPAVRATIVDSVTGLSAAYTSSLILTTEGRYDSTRFNEDRGVVSSTDAHTPFPLASNSSGVAGIYQVRVRRSGYRLWQRSGVVVDGDRCGALATSLDVRLQPEP
jgi:hypothetical protein